MRGRRISKKQVVDVLPPHTADFDDVYMVGELMDVDLHRAIYYGRPLSAEHIQFFMYQLLCGIKYIHSVGIVHRLVTHPLTASD